MRPLKRWAFLLLGFVIAPHARAQSDAADRLAEIKRAVRHADYVLAAALADSAIARYQDFSPPQLAEIHAWRALMALEHNDTALAEAHFLSVLQLSPDYQLDAIFFSPAVRDRFEQLRAQMPKSATPARAETRYVILPDPRLQAAWKSLLLPGWGQRAKGQPRRGAFFTITAATLTAATATAHILRQDAKEEYENAGEADAAELYDKYNRYHLWRNNLALALGVVWSAAVLDALWTPLPAVPARVGFALPARHAEAALSVSVSLSF